MGRTDSKTGGKQDGRQLTRRQREQRRVSEAQETGSTQAIGGTAGWRGREGHRGPGKGQTPPCRLSPSAGPAAGRHHAGRGWPPSGARQRSQRGRHPAPASRRRTPSPAPDEVTWNMFNSGTTKWGLLFPLFTSCKLSLCHLKKITTKNIAMSLGGKT